MMMSAILVQNQDCWLGTTKKGLTYQTFHRVAYRFSPGFVEFHEIQETLDLGAYNNTLLDLTVAVEVIMTS